MFQHVLEWVQARHLPSVLVVVLVLGPQSHVVLQNEQVTIDTCSDHTTANLSHIDVERLTISSGERPMFWNCRSGSLLTG